MNVIELSFVFICFGLGWAVGTLGGKLLGMPGYGAGWLVGLFLLPMTIRLIIKVKDSSRRRK